MPATWTEEGTSIVEGIGDEVLLFGSGFVALFVVLLTWLYLSYFNSEVGSSQDSAVSSERSVLRPPHPREASPQQTSPAREVQDENIAADRAPSQDAEPATAVHRDDTLDDTEESSGHIEELRPEQDQEEDCSPEELRLRRLEFYSKNNVVVSESGANGSGADSRHHASALTAAGTSEERAAGDAQDGTTGDAGQLTVRLKYLNDTERCVSGRQDETLGEFRRRHFAEELAGQRVVRLIFNGAQLSNDAATLSSCGIRDGCVVHVHISTMPSNSSPPPQTSAEVDLNLSALMWPLFATILGILWFLFFQYKELFNLTSTTILVGISGLFCIGLYGQYYPPRQMPASR